MQLKSTSKTYLGITYNQYNDYALSCGYYQMAKIGDWCVTLDKEHSVYRVKCIQNVGGAGYSLRTHLTLTEARKEFKKRIKELLDAEKN